MDTNEKTYPTNDQENEERPQWFFLCDQKRRNALDPAYKMLESKGFEVFTPTIKKIIGRGMNKRVSEVPLLTDILFVHSSKDKIDQILAVTPTLHYRYKKGGKFREHIIVRDEDMERFIYFSQHAEIKEFFAIEALPKELVGDTVVIHGGPLDGYEAKVRKMQGSKRKRVFIELRGMAYGEFELTNFISLETKK